MSGQAGRGGAALPLALLLVLGLTGLAYGLSAVATAEGRAARAAAEMEQGRLLAVAAAEAGVAALAGDSLPGVALWEETMVVSPRWRTGMAEVRLERAGREWHVMRVRSRASGTAAWWREARLVWALEPVARLVGASAVVARGGPLSVEIGSDIDGELWTMEGDSGEWSCPRIRTASDSLLPSGRLPTDVLVPDGARLGRADLSMLLDRIVPAPGGVWSPEPVVESGRCRTDVADNWGSPTDPSGPCGAHRPPRGFSGDLELRGGEGQGLLVVDGALRLESGAFFAGVVVVRDSLTVEDGARLVGLAMVGGPVRVRSTSRIQGGGCASALALSAAPALRSPWAESTAPPLRIR